MSTHQPIAARLDRGPAPYRDEELVLGKRRRVEIIVDLDTAQAELDHAMGQLVSGFEQERIVASSKIQSVECRGDGRRPLQWPVGG